MVKKSFKIEGMTCASCAIGIESSLKKTKGVKKATVNFANKFAQVDYDENEVNQKELFDVVTKKGYNPLDLNLKEVKFKVIGMSSEHCAGVVKNALSKLDGVSGVNANYANSSAEAKYDSEKIRISDMKKAIDNAG